MNQDPEEIQNTSLGQQQSNNLPSEAQEKWQKLNAELAFSTIAITAAADQFIENLGTAHSGIQITLKNLEQSAKMQEQTAIKVNDDARVLSLVPDKVQNRINALVPQIASEIDKIYSTKQEELSIKQEELIKQFALLQDKLITDITAYQQRLEKTTNQSIDKLSSAMQNFKITTDNKMHSFTDELLCEAKNSIFSGRIDFFKALFITIVFSSLISAGASYYVTNNLPRYFTIKSTNDLAIDNSRVIIESHGTIIDNSKQQEAKKNISKK